MLNQIARLKQTGRAKTLAPSINDKITARADDVLTGPPKNHFSEFSAAGQDSVSCLPHLGLEQTQIATAVGGNRNRSAGQVPSPLMIREFEEEPRSLYAFSAAIELSQHACEIKDLLDQAHELAGALPAGSSQ